MSGFPLHAWLEFALECCDAADDIAMAAFRRDMTITAKPDRTFVTETDQAVERVVRGRINRAFPDHGLVGEEYGSEAGQGTIRWYIDPIDATHNFMRGVPLFATLLAAEVEDEMVLGVMSAPALGSRWYATRGGGAWTVDALGPAAGSARRLHVSAVSDIGDAQILYSSADEIAAEGSAPGFGGVLRDSWRDRGFGDFWGYALLAGGSAEVMIEVGPHSWDLAAPSIVVEEAGGRFTDLAGERTIHSGNALATNGLMHRAILDRIGSDADRPPGP